MSIAAILWRRAQEHCPEPDARRQQSRPPGCGGHRPL